MYKILQGTRIIRLPRLLSMDMPHGLREVEKDIARYLDKLQDVFSQATTDDLINHLSTHTDIDWYTESIHLVQSLELPDIMYAIWLPSSPTYYGFLVRNRDILECIKYPKGLK